MGSDPEHEIDSQDVAAKTVRGSAYSMGASAVTMVLGFGRSVLMARLLLPEHFGIVAFALTFLNFTRPLRDFGLDEALIHRKPDKEMSLEDALAVHFTLRLILTGFFVLLLVGAIPVLRTFYPERPLLVPVLLALTLGEVAIALGATPSTYLRKEMRFRELAVLRVITSLSMTVIGPLMAWQGYGVWAIVGERISGLILATAVLLVLIRPWKPRWRLRWGSAKWYLDYGKFISATRGLGKFISEFDNFWIGTALGSQSLGFYSRAHEFANYPHRMISYPMTQVLFPAFSKLQDDKLRLSKAYYRASSLIVRTGFLIGGVLVLTSHEFVMLFLGSKWIPMIIPFQLMIVYVLLEPLKAVSAHLVNAVGRPQFYTRARAIQSVVALPLVVLGAHWWGIEGVAVAVNVVLLVGLASILHQIRALIQVSLVRMLSSPAVGLVISLLVGWQVSQVIPESALLRLISTTLAFATAYTLIMLVLEGREYMSHARVLSQLLTEPIRQSLTIDT